MAQEAPGQTLQPTALVHEAWLRLVGDTNQHWNNRGHFYAAAAEAMRRILIESARRKHALRRGGGQERVDLSRLELAAESGDDRMLEISEARSQFGSGSSGSIGVRRSSRQNPLCGGYRKAR